MTLRYHVPFNGLCYGFSEPTNLNRKFMNNWTRVAKFRDTVSSAIELTCNIVFDGAHSEGLFLMDSDNSLVLRV